MEPEGQLSRWGAGHLVGPPHSDHPKEKAPFHTHSGCWVSGRQAADGNHSQAPHPGSPENS